MSDKHPTDELEQELSDVQAAARRQREEAASAPYVGEHDPIEEEPIDEDPMAQTDDDLPGGEDDERDVDPEIQRQLAEALKAARARRAAAERGEKAGSFDSISGNEDDQD
jgi:hypothetical protein